MVKICLINTSGMTFKQKTHNHYLQLITDKVQQLQQILTDLKESGMNETKSTAGDKHETALAMLQIEQANVRQQLKDAQTQKAVMEKINPLLSPAFVVNGSLIKTNKGYFFVSVALGKAMIAGNRVIALSQKSPLGMQLMGLSVGEAAVVNNFRYLVESIE